MTFGDDLIAAPAQRSAASTFSAFGFRQFRLFYLGQLISVTGTWMQTAAQGWLVLVLTGSPFWLGVATAARTLPILFLSVAGGIAADLFDRRALLIVANTAAGLISAAMALLTIAGLIDITGVIVLALLLGVVMAFEVPARQSWTVELTAPGHLSNAIALNSMLFSAARIVGPAVAGLIVAGFGPGLAFALNALSFLPILAILLLIHTSAVRSPFPVRAAVADITSYLFGEARVVLLLGLLSINTVFAWAYLVLGPAMAQRLGRGPEGFGLLMAAAGLGAVVGGLMLAASSRSVPTSRTLFGSAFVVAAGNIVAGLVSSFEATLVALALIGWGLSRYTATTNTLIQSIVPDRLRGRIVSLYVVAVQGMMVGSGIVSGVLATAFGLSAAMAVSGAIWGIVLAAAYVAVRRRHWFEG